MRQSFADLLIICSDCHFVCWKVPSFNINIAYERQTNIFTPDWFWRSTASLARAEIILASVQIWEMTNGNKLCLSLLNPFHHALISSIFHSIVFSIVLLVFLVPFFFRIRFRILIYVWLINKDRKEEIGHQLLYRSHPRDSVTFLRDNRFSSIK